MTTAHIKSEESWVLLEDTPVSEVFVTRPLKLVSVLREGEERVTGEILLERATKEWARFGQRQAQYLLEHPTKIPGYWREYLLCFPGTIWRDSNEDRWLPCLRWRGST